MYNYGRIIGVILWSLIPGFIALKKRRSFWGYFFLSFLITPLITTIIVLCLKNLNKDGNSGDLDRVMLFCPVCGFTGSDKRSKNSQRCPKCNTFLKRTELTAEQWHLMTPEEKNVQKRTWGLYVPPTVNYDLPPTSGTTTNQLPDGNTLNCRYCGAEIPKDSVFCQYCGRRL